MITLIRCSRCEQAFQIPLHSLGKNVRCPYCSNVQSATTPIATGEDELYRPGRFEELPAISEPPAPTADATEAEFSTPAAALPTAKVTDPKLTAPSITKHTRRGKSGRAGSSTSRSSRKLEISLVLILCVLCSLVYWWQGKLDALFQPAAPPDWDGNVFAIQWDQPVELIEGGHLAILDKELVLRQGSEIRGIGFASEDELLVGYNFEGKGYLLRWKCRTSERHFVMTTGEITRIAVANGGTAAVLRNDGRVFLVTGLKVALLETEKPAKGVAISPSARHVALIGEETLEIWDIRRGRRLWSMPFKMPELRESNVPTATFSADDKTLAVPWRGRRICLFDVASGRQVDVLHGHDAPARAVAFSPDGRWLLSGDVEGNLVLHMGRNWKLRQPISQQNVPVSQIVIAPDNRTAVVAYRNSEIDWINVETGERVAQFRVGYKEVHGMAFSSSGRRFAAVSGDRRVQTWRTDPLMGEHGGR